jgi:hypothetical protein
MGIRILSTMLAACLLTSCASWTTRRIEPEPPRIDCGERDPAEPTPRRPKFGPLPADDATPSEWRSYVGRLHALWGAYSIRLLGTNEAVVTRARRRPRPLKRKTARTAFASPSRSVLPHPDEEPAPLHWRRQTVACAPSKTQAPAKPVGTPGG